MWYGPDEEIGPKMLARIAKRTGLGCLTLHFSRGGSLSYRPPAAANACWAATVSKNPLLCQATAEVLNAVDLERTDA